MSVVYGHTTESWHATAVDSVES